MIKWRSDFYCECQIMSNKLEWNTNMLYSFLTFQNLVFRYKMVYIHFQVESLHFCMNPSGKEHWNEAAAFGLSSTS